MTSDLKTLLDRYRSPAVDDEAARTANPTEQLQAMALVHGWVLRLILIGLASETEDPAAFLEDRFSLVVSMAEKLEGVRPAVRGEAATVAERMFSDARKHLG